MDFGLGLILSFTDNATSGINNAIATLDSLAATASRASSSLDQTASLMSFSLIANTVGDSMTSAGGAIISTFGEIISKVNETGTTLMYAENQLDKLYEGGARTGKDVLNDISEYAKKSIFEFENLIPVVTMLKANGIEAFDEIASSTGKSRQTLMDYAADLAAFNPQMHNAYGTGIQAAMGALNEYIAEGNARSLKSGASLDITGLLGEEKGATIEERSRQVADLLEQLNMVGMTAQLANTPMTKLSNMSDTLFQFLGMISNSGVYDSFNRIISIFADFVNNIPDDRLQEIAEVVGSALSSLMRPIEWLATKIVALADAFLNLVSANPGLAKLVTIATALSGVLLVVGGVAFKILGTIGMLTVGIINLGKSFSAIGTVMKAASSSIIGALVPLTLTIGLMYLIWKNDLFGIRTAVTTFVQNVVSSFQMARSAVGGSLENMQTVLATFDTSHSFFDGLTLAIMRVMTLGKALAEGWNDFTLSEDTFLKAKELGLLPLIEALFDFKYRFDLFKEGFMQGLKNVSDRVVEFFKGLQDSIDGTIFDSLLDGVTRFFQALSDNDPEAWRNFGTIIGEVAANALLLAIAFRAVSTAFSLISGIVSIVTGIASAISTIVSGIISVVQGVISFFSGIINAISSIASFLAPFASTLAGIGAVAAGAITAIISFVSMLKDGFSAVKEIVMLVGIAIAAVGAIILGVPALIAGVVAAVVAVVATLVVIIKEHWEQIKSAFSAVGQWFDTNVIQPIAGVFQAIGEFLGAVIGEIILGIKSIIDTIISFIAPVIDSLNTLVKAIGEAIGAICYHILAPVIKFIGSLLVGIWNIIVDVVTSIYNFLQPIVQIIVYFIMDMLVAAWQFIVDVCTTVWDFIVDVVVGIWNAVIGTLSSLWNGIVQIVNGILEVVLGILGNLIEAVANFLSGILNFIIGNTEEAKQNFADAGQAFIDIFTSAFQGIWDIVVGLLTGIGGAIGSLLNGIIDLIIATFKGLIFLVEDMWNLGVNIVKGLWNGIVSVGQWLLSMLLSWAMGIIDFVLGIFGVHSPSTVFAEIGVNLVQGLIQGIQSLISAVFALFQSIADTIISIFNTLLSTAQTIWSAISSAISTIVSAIWNTIVSIFNGILSTVTSVWNTIKSTITTVIDGIKSVVTSGWNAINSTISSVGSSIKSAVSSVFNGVKSTITSAIDGAKSVVKSGLDAIKGFFNNLELKLPHIKLPHFSISGDLSINPPSVPHLSVEWYKQGGIFDKPSIIGIGEQGREAVVPLEKNTEWIGLLAHQLNSIENNDTTPKLVPTNTTTSNSNTTNMGDSYITNNRSQSGDTIYEDNSDNRVVFSEGSIVIHCQNASEEEAQRLAKRIMQIIKRQKELDKMASYA